MKLEINSKAFFTSMNRLTRQAAKEHLTLKNPERAQLERMGKYAGNVPEYLKYYEQDGNTLTCHRGAAEAIYMLCKARGENINVVDNRLTLKPVQFEFKGKLRPFQEKGIQAMLPRTDGVLVFPTGGGKTIAMLSLVSRREQPCLVIVDKKELLYQWRDSACQFLDLEQDEVGIVGAGKFKIGDRLTIGTIQTISRRVDELKDRFAMIVVDECHKAGAPSFMETLGQFPAKYICGCTATPARDGGMTPVIGFALGPVRYTIGKQDLLDQGYLCQAKYQQVPTNFSTTTDASGQYTKVMGELVEDKARNELICRTIANTDTHGLSLILTGRVGHCDELKNRLKAYGINPVILSGKTPVKEREQVFERIKQGSVSHIISTTSLLKEGFDLPVLENLFLVFPVKWKGSIVQMIGRILRPAHGKECAMIYDFIDPAVGVLGNSARVRADVYKQEGIKAA